MGKTKKARDAERKMRQQQQEKFFPNFGKKVNESKKNKKD